MQIFYPSSRINLALVTIGTDLVGLDDSDILRLTAVKPRSVSVEHNDPHQADSFEVTLDEALFPIDPRLVKTLSVDVYLGDTGGLDKRLAIDDYSQHAILGVYDEIEKSYEATSNDTVTISGSDYSTFLIEADWYDHLDAVELGRPLDEIVREVLDAVPAAKPLSVYSAFDEVPTIEAGPGKRSRFRPKDKDNVWEGLYAIASRAGVLVTVSGDNVVLRPPRTARTNDPMPVFVAGRNIDTLKVRRNHGVDETPNVIVKAMDPSSFELIEGRYPDPPTQKTQITRSSGKAKKSKSETSQVFEVQHPAPTKAKLDAIAKRVWERYEQQQITVELQTKEMKVWELPGDEVTPERLDVSARSFDVTRLRNGSTFRLFVDRQSRDILRQAITTEEAARQLRTNGFREDVAREMAENWKVINTPMFVRTANHRIREGGKYSCSITAENRITV